MSYRENRLKGTNQWYFHTTQNLAGQFMTITWEHLKQLMDIIKRYVKEEVMGSQEFLTGENSNIST